MNFYSVILDIIVVVIFIASIVIGKKKGFMRSVMWLVVLAVSFFVASKFTSSLSAYIEEKYVKDAVGDKVSALVSDIFSTDSGKEQENGDIGDKIDEKKNAVEELLAKFSLSFEDLSASLREKTDKTVKDITDFISAPVSKTLSVGIAFAVLFFGSAIILYLVMLLLCRFFETEALSGVNSVMGGFLGALKGLAICFGLCYALCRILPYIGTLDGKLPPDIIANTFIVKFLGKG